MGELVGFGGGVDWIGAYNGAPFSMLPSLDAILRVGRVRGSGRGRMCGEMCGNRLSGGVRDFKSRVAFPLGHAIRNRKSYGLLTVSSRLHREDSSKR
jgi:hypothetical protein